MNKLSSVIDKLKHYSEIMRGVEVEKLTKQLNSADKKMNKHLNWMINAEEYYTNPAYVKKIMKNSRKVDLHKLYNAQREQDRVQAIAGLGATGLVAGSVGIGATVNHYINKKNKKK